MINQLFLVQVRVTFTLSRIKPAALQCECHPYLNQEQLIDHCRKLNIVCKFVRLFSSKWFTRRLTLCANFKQLDQKAEHFWKLFFACF